MTATCPDEAGFHAAIEADPDDATAMLVFADWLQDRDDPRAAGYRVMAEMGKRPWENHDGGYRWRYLHPEFSTEIIEHRLPDPWHSYVGEWEDGTFTERLDAAALAWSELTDSEREKILADAGCGG